ncbi:hypothetical protein D3C77_198280 [compost metagenome]
MESMSSRIGLAPWEQRSWELHKILFLREVMKRAPTIRWSAVSAGYFLTER